MKIGLELSLEDYMLGRIELKELQMRWGIIR
jgi:hypothetical protein